MFSIFLLLAAFSTGDGLTVLWTIVGLSLFWCFVISELKKGASTKYTPHKKDPMDKQMDDNYMDIDWLRNGKL